MNDSYFATVKAYEASDRLRAVQAAVETLHGLETTREACAVLEALLAALEAQAEVLDTYTKELRGRR